ncbi:DUF3422 family protein [Oceanicaulis sp. LC35]|uniref:DUF3422 family protein n=1 Tax=Oceanicaulis sp. LC35 TaxID=3349635 RepID=UPI003F84B745
MDHNHENWRESAYMDREPLIHEIHKRQPFPLRPYVRATHMVRIFPSLADRVREHIVASDSALSPEQEADAPFNTEQLLANKAPVHVQLDETLARQFLQSRDALLYQRRNAVKAYIRGLSPTYSPSLQITPSEASDMLGEVYKDYMNKRSTLPDYASLARAEIKRLERLYEEDGPLHLPDTLGLEQADGRFGARPLLPYRTGGASRKRWFNFWKKTADSPRSPELEGGEDLRLNWELYGLNQNFTVIEDYNEGHLPPLSSTAPDTSLADSDDAFFDNVESINTGRTAIDGFEQRLQALCPETARSFRWCGDLLSVSHVWMLPIEKLLIWDNSRVTARDQALLWKVRSHPGVLDAGLNPEEFERLQTLLVRFAQPFFGTKDPTRANWERKDFIMSRVVGDRAFLLADLQQHSRKHHNAERASRVVVIDFGMSDEQRGRLLKRIYDIATYRMLGLRDYSYFFCAQTVTDGVNIELDKLSGDLSKLAETEGNDAHAYEKRLQEHIQQLLQLDARLSSLNFFIADGLTPSAKSTETYLNLAQERIESLREARMPGHQTVGEYLRRFEGSARNVIRIAEQYEMARTRLAELIALARAETDRVRTNKMSAMTSAMTKMTRWVLILSFITVGASVLGLLAPQLIALSGH